MRHALLPLLVLLSVRPTFADERRLDAKTLFAQAVTHNVRLTADGTALELDEGELFEDDGPAAGYSYQPNEERLTETVWVRKELVIPDPKARKAMLLVAPGGTLQAIINGKPLERKSPTRVGQYWQGYAVPPELLKAGVNRIVLQGRGRMWIVRAEDFAAGSDVRPKHPGRSAKSTDGGKTWAVDRLGPGGNSAGEYYVRLVLDHHRPAGTLILPVYDAGNLDGKPIAPPLAKLVPFRIHVDANAGTMTRLRLRVRSGTTTTPDANNWSAWRDLEPGRAFSDPKGRFFQIAVDLSTTDPLQTPRLKAIRIEATPPKGSDWSEKLKVLGAHNEAIVRSSVPFTYEPFTHPRLRELRTKYHLDDVVKGAKTELELIEKLARWSEGRWDAGHLKDGYPPWDALEILKPHADGTPTGGFCQQYNLVFLQACESFGIPGRAVSISQGDHGLAVRGSGHEVVELWSNHFKKWIYVDGNMAWYAVDSRSGVPLSLRELRSRQLALSHAKKSEAVRIVELQEGKRRWTGLDVRPPFGELRLIPRSNFLEQKSPLPLHQGMRGWFWTGHLVWTDEAYPASLLYGNRVTDVKNWDWTLNQAHVTLEATATPGEMRVHLDTETPGFETFLASLDDGEAQPVSSGFVWKLKPGKNRLEVWPRNTARREGIRSWLVVERLP